MGRGVVTAPLFVGPFCRPVGAYRRQGLPGSGVIDFALRLRNVTIANDRRKDGGGL